MKFPVSKKIIQKQGTPKNPGENLHIGMKTFQQYCEQLDVLCERCKKLPKKRGFRF